MEIQGKWGVDDAPEYLAPVAKHMAVSFTRM